MHTLRSAHYATELQFVDMRVPDENILGEVNKGFAIANDRLTRQRIPYAAGCIGVAIKAQEMALEYVPQERLSAHHCPVDKRFNGCWSIMKSTLSNLWITVEAAAGGKFPKGSGDGEAGCYRSWWSCGGPLYANVWWFGVAKDLPLKDGFAKCAFDALERDRVRFRDM